MFTERQIVDLLTALSGKRPIFHSEADFQHELAWLLHHTNSQIQIRLEKPLKGVGEVDIMLREDNREFLIELKYKTRKMNSKAGNEEFALKSHGAQPLGRYDGLKDISRIVKSKMNGCTIFLTNESQYWNVEPDGNGAHFSLQGGRALQNVVLKWCDNTKVKSIGKGRVSGISLAGPYTLKWRQYGSTGSEFCYLLVMV